VVGVNSTTYTVNIVDTTNGNTITATVWLLKNGTVARLDLPFPISENYTQTAGEYFKIYFGLWERALGLGQQIQTYTSSSFFHSTGTSTVAIGPSEFTVTNYTASSFPVTIAGCNGGSTTVTSGIFSVGTASGSSYALPIYVNISGSTTTVSKSGTQSTTTFSATFQVTSVTVA
jgi:hypothetical protein